MNETGSAGSTKPVRTINLGGIALVALAAVGGWQVFVKSQQTKDDVNLQAGIQAIREGEIIQSTSANPDAYDGACLVINRESNSSKIVQKPDNYQCDPQGLVGGITSGKPRLSVKIVWQPTSQDPNNTVGLVSVTPEK
jgi:hypothetical protein